jgi:hypothetical protein
MSAADLNFDTATREMSSGPLFAPTAILQKYNITSNYTEAQSRLYNMTSEFLPAAVILVLMTPRLPAMSTTGGATTAAFDTISLIVLIK